MLAGGLERSGQRNAGDPTVGPVTLITKSDQIWPNRSKSDQIGDTQYQIGDIFGLAFFSDADI